MKQLIVLTALFISTTASLVAQDALRKKHFHLESGLAIQGYDPVSYFTANKAVKGKKELAYTYQGATYYFSSAANQQAFKTAPALYEPQYGGWCAYAMGAKGEKVEIDPETFTIINGKLFLFYHSFFNNTLKEWQKDEKNLHQKADANWVKIFH